MNFWRALSVFLILGFLFKMSVYANDTMKHESLVVSFSGVLQKCILQGDRISIAGNILNNDKWSHVYWPSYDGKKESIYFVAKSGLDQDANTNIFSISLLAPNQEPKKLIDNARYPSLSPNNNLLAFYRHPNQLWIQSLKNMNAQKAASDIASYQPCVWVSNTHLLYIDSNNELVLFDVPKGEKQKTRYSGIVPGALSPDGKKVLCGSSDGKKIYFYFPLSNKIEPIKESKFRSMGTSFIWLPDGSGFLFTMQTWSNILRLNESRDLFLYMVNEREETLLLSKAALFGGAFISLK
jgi:hypothetical protein